MRIARQDRLLRDSCDRVLSDVIYAWRDKLIIAGLERSRAADARALATVQEMENR